MKNLNKNAGEEIQKTTDKLTSKGIPSRTAAYAASMGYLRNTKKK